MSSSICQAPGEYRWSYGLGLGSVLWYSLLSTTGGGGGKTGDGVGVAMRRGQLSTVMLPTTATVAKRAAARTITASRRMQSSDGKAMLVSDM